MSTLTPIAAIRPDSLKFIGTDLNRPECVLATRSGELFASDGRGGVSIISAEQTTRVLLARGAPADLKPNGIAVLADGSFLLANLGRGGGVWQMQPDGETRPYLTEVDGRSISSANFVGIDAVGRVWITISTWSDPFSAAAVKGHADGFVVLKDGAGARIVTEGLGFTNEGKVDPSGAWFYVNETVARRLSRLAIRLDGTLGVRETVTEFGKGSFPDGLAFDAEGNVWVTCVVGNRIIRVVPDSGKQDLVIDDADPANVEAVEIRFQAGLHPGWSAGENRLLANPSSLAFGGPDLRTVYVGTVLGRDLIGMFRSPVAGAEPPHWRFRDSLS